MVSIRLCSNGNSVILYSPSCYSKPVRFSFLCERKKEEVVSSCFPNNESECRLD